MKITKKIVLLGHFGVGKTSLVRRFIDNEFNTDYMVTIGVQVKKKNIKIKEGVISLIIWDLEGNSSIEKSRSSYLLGSSGFIYVFDLSRPETFENLSSEMAYLKKNFENIPVLTIGNKEDLTDSKITQKFFKANNIEITGFTSAKTGKCVNEIFHTLSKLILQNEDYQL